MRKWHYSWARSLPLLNFSVYCSLREIDIELMRRLSPRVNVIPVIGRADSLTPQELKDFKRRVCPCKGSSCY